jgi:hypothetical protein
VYHVVEHEDEVHPTIDDPEVAPPARNLNIFHINSPLFVDLSVELCDLFGYLSVIFVYMFVLWKDLWFDGVVVNPKCIPSFLT